MLARESRRDHTEAFAEAKTPRPSRRTVCDPNHRATADFLRPCERSFSASRQDREETHSVNARRRLRAVREHPLQSLILTDAEHLADGCERGSLEELADWTDLSDKVLVF